MKDIIVQVDFGSICEPGLGFPLELIDNAIIHMHLSCIRLGVPFLIFRLEQPQDSVLSAQASGLSYRRLVGSMLGDRCRATVVEKFFQ